MSPRQSAWLAVGVLSLGIAIGYGADLRRWATLEREYFFTNHDDFAGWRTVHRFTGESAGEYRYWDIETGMLVSSGWMSGLEERLTAFAKDGRILHQEHARHGGLEERSEPPWWWGSSRARLPTRRGSPMDSRTRNGGSDASASARNEGYLELPDLASLFLRHHS